MSNRLSYTIAGIILLLAAGLRLWDVSTLPLGLHSDEVTNLRLMETIRRNGNISVFYNISGDTPIGQEGFYPTAQAIATLFFTSGSLGYRMLGIFASIITLPLIYTLGVRLYGRTAGLLAMALMGFNMWAVLLGHQVVMESILMPLVVATMLALARALPVYRETDDERTNTTTFAALGILLGMSFYIHPASLVLVLGSMLTIAYSLLFVRPFSGRRLSYTGFAILLTLIISVPYLLSSVRLPELAASGRFFDDVGGVIEPTLRSLAGMFFTGDHNPITNIPGRPLFNPLTLILVAAGLLISLRRIRQPRFALMLIMTVSLMPYAFLRQGAPDFFGLTILMPSVALLFGFGGAWIFERLQRPYTFAAIAAFVALFAYLGISSGVDLYSNWRAREDVRRVYRSDIGEIAHYIDATSAQIPTVFCDNTWQSPVPRTGPLTRAQIIRMMLNTTEELRTADCRNALIFANAGQRHQIVLSQADIVDDMHPFLKFWLDNMTPVASDNLPENSVYIYDNPELLANQLGIYTTTAPATFPLRNGEAVRSAVPPPIRFGGNITWMGYERTDVQRTYQPGDTVPVINFWRVEGIVPADLLFFTHILQDPVSVAANRDVIYVDPRTLSNRDVFVQVTEIPLPLTFLPGNYDISIGAYQQTSETRLPIFDEDQVRDERLILYNITVAPPPEQEQ